MRITIGVALVGAGMASVWTVQNSLAADMAKLQQQVADQLRDPESARFRGLYILPYPCAPGPGSCVAVESLCGYVNAKNGFGGYTGFMPFHAMLDKNKNVYRHVFIAESEGSDLIQRYCSRS